MPELFWNVEVRVFSAWAANAIPVAEFSVAQIILANKGYFQVHNRYKQSQIDARQYADSFCGNYGANVVILGVGMIGRYVIKLLTSYSVNITVFDLFLSEAQAQEMGVKKASLEKIFSSCDTV